MPDQQPFAEYGQRLAGPLHGRRHLQATRGANADGLEVAVYYLVSTRS